jgi:hypothetical protein
MLGLALLQSQLYREAVKQLEKVYTDMPFCKKVFESPRFFRVITLSGIVDLLTEEKASTDGIRSCVLLKALELGRGGKPGSYMVEEIWQELAKARYTEWEQGAIYRRRQQQDLRCGWW